MKLSRARRACAAGVSVVVLAGADAAISTYDRHVLFDNSLPDRSYDNTANVLVAPSTLETYEGKFPVETQHFVSPPNSLRLRWKSAPGTGRLARVLRPADRPSQPFRPTDPW